MLTTPNKPCRTSDGRRRGATDRSYRAGSYQKQVQIPRGRCPMRRGRVFATRAAVYDNLKEKSLRYRYDRSLPIIEQAICDRIGK